MSDSTVDGATRVRASDGTPLGVLAGCDADLAPEATRLTNRLHDARCTGLQRWNAHWASTSATGGALELLAAAGTPTQLTRWVRPTTGGR